MKSAWPLLVDKTAIAATGLVLSLDKAAIVDKTAIEAGGLDAQASPMAKSRVSKLSAAGKQF